jgi:MtN3 and saliva related transmembrane protein
MRKLPLAAFLLSKDGCMTVELSDLIGYPAAFLTTVAFVPQAWKSWQTRDLSGISLPMYALFTLGVALWLVYGVAISSAPIVLANAITLMLSALVLWLKVIEGRSAR